MQLKTNHGWFISGQVSIQSHEARKVAWDAKIRVFCAQWSHVTHTTLFHFSGNKLALYINSQRAYRQRKKIGSVMIFAGRMSSSSVPSKERNCAVPPDNFSSAFSFSGTSNMLNLIPYTYISHSPFNVGNASLFMCLHGCAINICSV